MVLVTAVVGKNQSNPATSKEIRHFIETHKERRPGTVPLLLVLRDPD
jgi:hypothetical protein